MEGRGREREGERKGMWGGGRKIGRKGDGGGGESPNPHLLFANKILFCHFPIVRAPILKDITPGVGG